MMIFAEIPNNFVLKKINFVSIPPKIFLYVCNDVYICV